MIWLDDSFFEDDPLVRLPLLLRPLLQANGIDLSPNITSQSAVVRIWRAFGLQPHRTETFKLSTDSLFIENFIVGVALVGVLHRFGQVLLRNRTAAILTPVLVILNGGFGWMMLWDDVKKIDGGVFQVLRHIPHSYTILPNVEEGWRWGNAVTSLLATQRGFLLGIPLAVIVFTQWWAAKTRPAHAVGVHASAVVDPAAVIGAGVSIGPLAVVEAGAVIDEGAVIGAQCFVGRGAGVGAHTRLAPRVVLGSGCRIGARGIVHSGVVMGADGFGFAPVQGRWEKIEQLGAVRIGDDVEIGANTCIDRGALDDTVIEDGVKMDNQIQIAHNVKIGANTAIAACVGIAGSAIIGRNCAIGGAAMLRGHIVIADNVSISAGTLVQKEILEPGEYTGVYPFTTFRRWVRNAARAG